MTSTEERPLIVSAAEADTIGEIDFDIDIPPTVNDVAPLRCQFDGCLNSVTKPARGRTPKFCDEHRNTARTPAGRKSAGWANSGDVERILAKYFESLGTAIAFVNENDGRIVATGGKDVAHELVELARQDKKLRDLLVKITTPGKYGPLSFAVIFGILLPIMINHELIPQLVFTSPRESGGESEND